jgi:hypothetical protein
MTSKAPDDGINPQRVGVEGLEILTGGKLLNEIDVMQDIAQRDPFKFRRHIPRPAPKAGADGV